MNYLIFIALGTFAFLFGAKEAMASAESDSVTDSEGLRQYGDNWKKYDALFRQASSEYGVPFRWLKGIAMNESSLGTNERVIAGDVSYDGKSWGLMQFTLPTARDYDSSTTPDKLNDAAFSIDLAGQFLRDLSKRFNSDERKVIMSYNQGAGATAAGKQNAAGYYAKFLDHVSLVDAG